MFVQNLAIPLVLLSIASTSLAEKDIFGLRKQIYIPRCAHACRATIQDSALECTKKTTQPQCFASNEPYLQTLAFCIASHCKNEPDAALDKFWSQYVVGWQMIAPKPIYGYQNALEKAGVPLLIHRDGEGLEKVSKVTEKDYENAFTALADWNESESYHRRFALTLFLLIFLLPVLLSLSKHIRLPSGLSSKYRAYFVYPLAWSSQWSISIRDAEDWNPTRGQAIFIGSMILINALLSSPGHFALSHHFWSFDGRHGQFIACLANRFGALSLANIPLLFLFPGRNSILLRMTSWSHATFVLLHRWLAYVTILEAVLHSILYLHVAVQQRKHTEWARMEAWYCGSISTIAVSLILLFSLVVIRRRAYEVFLLLHIALSGVVLVGTYYHVSRLFNTSWAGYLLYLWLALGLWIIDRLSRIARIARNGISRAHVTVIDEEYIRVDVPKLKAIGHAYLYFPTLTYRFWENHPFSVLTTAKTSKVGTPTILPLSPYFHRRSVSTSKGSGSISSSKTFQYSPTIEMRSVGSFSTDKSTCSPKSPMSIFTPISPSSAHFPISPARSAFSDPALLSPTSTTNLVMFPTPTQEKTLPGQQPQGISFFMRTHSGTTAKLRKRTSLPVLVESSYGLPTPLDAYPLLICVAGGVGITAILPYLHAHKGQAKLFWGSRSQALVNALREEVRGYGGEIIVGRRLFVKLALQREFEKVKDDVAVAVVVSGPKGMGDDVRELVCEIAKARRGDVRLLDENFGW